MIFCPICGTGEPAPIACEQCTERVRRDLATILDLRTSLDAWIEIDPGTPCLDQPHRLALVDNPILTASGGPDLTVIAATDVRTKRVMRGWHDTECGDARCKKSRAVSGEPCIDPEHRHDAADDVVNVDGELLTEARLIVEDRGLSMLPASVGECLRIIEESFEWSIRSPRVDEFAAVMASCALGLRALMRDLPDPPLGRCPQPDPKGVENACGGPLRWRSDTTAWSSEGSDDLAAIELVCGRCSDVTPGDARSLAGMLRVSGRAGCFPTSKAWLVAEFGVTDVWVRKWVMRGQIRRYNDGQVDLIDVMRLLDTQSADVLALDS